LDGTLEKPQRDPIDHFYSRKFSDTRVKPCLEARLAVLERQAEMTGGPPPKTIDVVTKVTAEAWEETPTFMRAALHPRIDGTSRRFGFHRACTKRPRHSYDGGTCVLAVPCPKNISKEKIT
jgi:hypothetical protein